MDGIDEWDPTPRKTLLKKLKAKQGLGFVESPLDPVISEAIEEIEKYDEEKYEFGPGA